MDLKKRLILLSDELDRAGLTKASDLIDLTLKVAMDSKLSEVLEATTLEEDDEATTEG
jgi:hypothetical protein